MAGTAPSVTRELFSETDLYEMLAQEQGKPIFDAMLNYNAKFRIWMQNRMSVNMFGVGRTANGWVLAESGASNVNNFKFGPGVAVDDKGRLLRVLDDTMASVPSAEYEYQDQGGFTYDNYLVRGAVSAVDDGLDTLTDSSFTYAAEMLFADCKLKMLSGAKSGTIYEIISVAGSVYSLQADGGGAADLAGIIAEDTFVVYDKDLTTPGAPRTDDVYLMTWMEYIDEREDTDLDDPTTTIASFQAWQLRWCVRVDEGQAGIFVGTAAWDGINYHKIGEFDRLANNTILASYLNQSYSGYAVIKESLKALGDMDESLAFPSAAFGSVNERLQALECRAKYCGQGLAYKTTVAGNSREFLLYYKVEREADVHSMKLWLRQELFEQAHYSELARHDHSTNTGTANLDHVHPLSGGVATANTTGGSSHEHALIDQTGGNPIGHDNVDPATGWETVLSDPAWTDKAPTTQWKTSLESSHTHGLGGSTDIQDIASTHAHVITSDGQTLGGGPSYRGLAQYTYGDSFTVKVITTLDGVPVSKDITTEVLAQLALAKLGDSAGGHPLDLDGGVEIDLKAISDADGLFDFYDGTRSRIELIPATDETGGYVHAVLSVN